MSKDPIEFIRHIQDECLYSPRRVRSFGTVPNAATDVKPPDVMQNQIANSNLV